MVEAKKPVAKKPAAVKKPAAKKPASAKAPAAKKPAAKKPVAKKSVAKKTAVKTGGASGQCRKPSKVLRDIKLRLAPWKYMRDVTGTATDFDLRQIKEKFEADLRAYQMQQSSVLRASELPELQTILIGMLECDDPTIAKDKDMYRKMLDRVIKAQKELMKASAAGKPAPSRVNLFTIEEERSLFRVNSYPSCYDPFFRTTEGKELLAKAEAALNAPALYDEDSEEIEACYFDE